MLAGIPVWAGPSGGLGVKQVSDVAVRTDISSNHRASYWFGFGDASSVSLQVLPVQLGWSTVGTRSYVPVNSALSACLLGITWADDQWNLFRGNSAPDYILVPLALTSLANGLRLTVGNKWAMAFVGHNLEVYAPHAGVGEVLELGASLFFVEGTVYRRFASVNALSDWGLTLGVHFRWLK